MRTQYLGGNTSRVIVNTESEDFPNVFANGGTGWKNPPDPDGAYPGTIFFFTRPPQGTIFTIR